ncbi:MAG TPA: LamG-like jellyroll fold domain-containing protein, partial [Actinoplanes sp.]
MTPTDLADGANVLQKGYSVGGGSQFKLQVDHEAGHPSCVIAGNSKIYKAEPRIDVADGRWHELACTRSGARLSITVDGVEADSVRLPAALSIANAEPLRIGGKGANARNDQYAGQIDDVFLEIS